MSEACKLIFFELQSVQQDQSVLSKVDGTLWFAQFLGEA